MCRWFWKLNAFGTVGIFRVAAPRRDSHRSRCHATFHGHFARVSRHPLGCSLTDLSRRALGQAMLAKRLPHGLAGAAYPSRASATRSPRPSRARANRRLLCLQGRMPLYGDGTAFCRVQQAGERVCDVPEVSGCKGQACSGASAERERVVSREESWLLRNPMR